ncbi:collagen alpha-1(III) chain-like [Myotis myotis]|uniref:collagen alpha-1(III) chain-like n=1 Tax=Myotis myotis TaxID=51298 RepID=UPI00174E7605|nr:collagen alpha-1(III) chain-like [Myotis myotis]
MSPDKTLQKEVAVKLKPLDLTIKTWFRNPRAKLRKQQQQLPRRQPRQIPPAKNEPLAPSANQSLFFSPVASDSYSSRPPQPSGPASCSGGSLGSGAGSIRETQRPSEVREPRPLGRTRLGWEPARLCAHGGQRGGDSRGPETPDQGWTGGVPNTPRRRAGRPPVPGLAPARPGPRQHSDPFGWHRAPGRPAPRPGAAAPRGWARCSPSIGKRWDPRTSPTAARPGPACPPGRWGPRPGLPSGASGTPAQPALRGDGLRGRVGSAQRSPGCAVSPGGTRGGVETRRVRLCRALSQGLEVGPGPAQNPPPPPPPPPAKARAERSGRALRVPPLVPRPGGGTGPPPGRNLGTGFGTSGRPGSARLPPSSRVSGRTFGLFCFLGSRLFLFSRGLTQPGFGRGDKVEGPGPARLCARASACECVRVCECVCVSARARVCVNVRVCM